MSLIARLTALLSNTTIAFIQDGVLLGFRQPDMRNSSSRILLWYGRVRKGDMLWPIRIFYFTVTELEQRQQQVRKQLVNRGLDGMLLFKIEDMYWLCGLDTDDSASFTTCLSVSTGS